MDHCKYTYFGALVNSPLLLTAGLAKTAALRPLRPLACLRTVVLRSLSALLCGYSVQLFIHSPQYQSKYTVTSSQSLPNFEKDKPNTLNFKAAAMRCCGHFWIACCLHCAHCRTYGRMRFSMPQSALLWSAHGARCHAMRDAPWRVPTVPQHTAPVGAWFTAAALAQCRT